MLTIQKNPAYAGLSRFVPDIVYSTATGTDLTLDLISPWTHSNDTTSAFPLVVFIQGSAWHDPDTTYQLPQLGRLSEAGYVVATVRHRNISNGHAAPAYLKDVKTAIRFLRAHAQSYHIDSDRVYAFGTSSGGNTALLLGLTANMDCFRTSEYSQESDHVDAVIDCFGPTNLLDYLDEKNYPNASEGYEQCLALFTEFCGGSLDEALLRQMSPVTYVTPDRSYVPFLLAHGNADQLVPFAQSQYLESLLRQYHADVSLICVDGADHEGAFWSLPLWDMFRNFLDKQAGK